MQLEQSEIPMLEGIDAMNRSDHFCTSTDTMIMRDRRDRTKQR